MIGVILTTYGGEGADAVDALWSLDKTRDYPSRVFVVSSNAPPGLLGEIKVGVPWLTDIFVTPEKLSLTQALNKGIRHFLANPDFRYIAWIHPDMSFPEPWLSAMVNRLIENPLIGKIHPNNLRDGHREKEEPGNETPWIIPSQIFLEVGLFDEKFSIGYEDWDLNRRIINAGYQVVVSPLANIMHAGMVTRNRESTTSRYDMARNHDVYLNKWGDTNPPC